jgi:hypothetical protein
LHRTIDALPTKVKNHLLCGTKYDGKKYHTDASTRVASDGMEVNMISFAGDL